MSDIQNAATVEITFIGNDGPVRATYANVLRDLKSQNVPIGGGGGAGGPSYSANGRPYVATNSTLSDRYETRYENRLASDGYRQQKAQDAQARAAQAEERAALRRAERAERSWDAAGLAGQKEEERATKAESIAARRREEYANKVSSKVSRAQAELDMSLAPDKSARADVLRQYAGGLEEGSPEQLRAYARANSLETGGDGITVKSSSRGYLGLGRLGQLATAGYLIHAGLAAVNDTLSYREQFNMADGSTLKQWEAYKNYQSGLFGIPLAGQVASLIDKSVNAVTGRSSADQTLHDIRLHTEESDANEARRQRVSEWDLDVGQTRRAAARIRNPNAYSRSVQETYDAHQTFIDKLDAEDAALEAKAAKFKAAGDQPEYERAVADAATFKLAREGRINADEEEQRAKRGDLYRNQIHETASTNYQTASNRDLVTGNYLRGAVEAIKAQFLPNVDEKTGVITGFAGVNYRNDKGQRIAGIKDEDFASFEAKLNSYTTGVDEAKLKDAQRVVLRDSQISSLRAQLSYQPLTAQLREIEGERDAALVGIDNIEEKRKITERYRLQSDIARQDYTFGADTNKISLEGEARAIASGLARDPGEAAEAANLDAAGVNRMRGLYRSGQTDNAIAAGQNSLMQLDLLRQNYFDSFHGAQVDAGLIATQGGRQSEDPKSVVDAIDKAKADLVTELVSGFADVMMNAINGG